MGVRCCTCAFSSWSERGLLSACVPRLLTASAPLGGAWAGGRLSSCAVCNQLPLGRVDSSPTRGQTSVPCTDRQILNHWTTREIKLLKTEVVHGKLGFRKDLF